MPRYERKYRIQDVDRAVVEQVLRTHPASLKKLYPNRQINNIYFDTNGLTAYKENVTGVANRKKYRVRWYGYEPTVVKNPRLEIKIRQNEVGDKLWYDMEEFDWADLSTLTKQVNQYAAPNVLQPVLQNSYTRAYFGTADGQFRLTLDWDLNYTSLLTNRIFRKPQFREKNTIILEIKYDRELEQQANRITQYIPFRRGKNSKYVSGIEYCR